MEQWFYNQFHTIFEQHAHLQPTPARRGQPGFPLSGSTSSSKTACLPCASRSIPRAAFRPKRADVLNAVRAAFNAGTLGEGVVAVNAPGEASLAQQTEAGHAAALERESRRGAQPEEGRGRSSRAAAGRGRCRQRVSRSPSVADAERIEAAKAEEEMQAKLEEMYGEEEPEFVVDFTMWDVEYADGSVRTFDSAAGEFVKEA